MIQLATTKRETRIAHIFVRPPFALPSSDGSSPDFLRDNMIGLYRSIVIAAFRLPLIRLNGRNAGISMPATVSRGTFIYKGVIR